MIKKLLLASLLGGCFFGMRAEEPDVVQQLLRQVDLVLFLLEQNTVRMERYYLYELESDVNLIPKALSKERCVFKINLTEKNSRANIIAWDQNSMDRIKISANKKRNPKTYYLMLEKIISSDVQLEDLSMVCFNCAVDLSKTPKTKAGWKSAINVIVPAGDQQLKLQLVLDGKIDSACGLFVQNDVFDTNLPVCGKLSKQEAIDFGVLVPHIEEKLQDLAGVETLEGTQKKRFLGVEVSSLFFDQLKTRLVASFDAAKTFFNSTWKWAWGFIY